MEPRSIVSYSYAVNKGARVEAVRQALTTAFSRETAQAVLRFHQHIPGYQPTPLFELPSLSRRLGLAKIWLKDESCRFGLNAFKILGASYGILCALQERSPVVLGESGLNLFGPSQGEKRWKGITLVTATDGNHGKAVAWSARRLGCDAVVYMPKGSSLSRVGAIEEQGARVVVVNGNYDDAVRLAADQAERNGWVLIQDTPVGASENVSKAIMKGYMTILTETFQQLEREKPTHVLVQCGVGSLAGALLGYLVECFGAERPLFIVVEPKGAAGFYESFIAGDGRPHPVRGPLKTMMAGLACGVPSGVAWEILREYADIFVACGDEVTMKGMRVLGNPLGDDPRIISGESGAVTLGLVVCALEAPSFHGLSEVLKLDNQSRILVISTEGDTDPEMYRKVVWGLCSNG